MLALVKTFIRGKLKTLTLNLKKMNIKNLNQKDFYFQPAIFDCHNIEKLLPKMKA